MMYPAPVAFVPAPSQSDRMMGAACHVSRTSHVPDPGAIVGRPQGSTALVSTAQPATATATGKRWPLASTP